MSITAMKMALEALEDCVSGDITPYQLTKSITVLRQAIEQSTEQEPVAVWELQESGWDTIADGEWMETLPIGTKLYTSPPQRKPWVGLTDDEVREVYGIDWDYKDGDYARYARAIEDKLKQKNGYIEENT